MGVGIVPVLSLFILIVTVSNTVLVWLGATTAQSSTLAVVDTLRTDVDNRVTEYLTHELLTPTAAVLRISRLAAMGWIDIENDNQMIRELYTDIFTWQYSGQYVGSASGIAHLSAMHNSTSISVSFTNATLMLRCDYYSPIGVDPAPAHTSNYYKPCWKYVPYQRPWYVQQAANLTQSPRYSSIYYFVGLQGAVPGITLTCAIYNTSGAFVGVSALDMYLTFLDDVAVSIASNIGENTVAYIVESTGLLVATSKGLSGGTNVRFSATNTSAEPPEVTVSASALDFASLAMTSTSTHFAITVHASESWVDVIPIRVLNLEWYFVVVLNSDDFLAMAKAMETQVIIIACVITVTAFLITVAVMAGIITPLRILQQEMAAVAGMDLESVQLSRAASKLTEVASMQKSFLRMVYNMVEYRNYMPASILTRDEEILEEHPPTPNTCASPTAQMSNANSPGQQGLSVTVAADAISLHSHKSSALSSSCPSTPLQKNNGFDTRKVHATISSMEVKKKRITIAVTNLRGFTAHVQANPDTLSAVHSTYITHLLDAVNTYHGIPDVFQGDRFVATWNAARIVGSHQLNACHAITKAIFDVQTSTTLQLSSAITSGECRCGNMGCPGMKKFTFIGTAASVVFIAERLTRHYGAHVIIDGGVRDEVGSLYGTRTLDYVTVARLTERPILLHELQSLHPIVKEDEWMYQLDQGAGQDPLLAYNSAMELYLSGDVEGALALLSKEPLVGDAETSQRLREVIETWTSQGVTGAPQPYRVRYF